MTMNKYTKAAWVEFLRAHASAKQILDSKRIQISADVTLSQGERRIAIEIAWSEFERVRDIAWAELNRVRDIQGDHGLLARADGQ